MGLETAAEICRSLPAFVTAVGLFVNSSRDLVRSVIESVPIQLLQFHGDEVEEQCCGYGLPYIKAVRTMPGVDLLECALSFPTAQGLLLDAPVEGFGGGGKTFDWSLIPAQLPLPLVLAGGLSPDNVARAVAQVRPWAVDVSSGVESEQGVKDMVKIAQFISGVRDGDQRIALQPS